MSPPTAESSENASRQNGQTDLTNRLSGMTGFGRSAGEADWGSWVWETKSVNGRGLDVRVNIPNGLDSLERIIKSGASARINRGNLQVALRLDLAAASDTGLNEVALNTMAAAYEARTGAAPDGPALATLMASRAVQESGGSAGETLRAIGQDDQIIDQLSDSLTTALDELVVARKAEGEALHTMLTDLLDQMTKLHGEASDLAGEQPKLLKDRLMARLKELDAEENIDAERLAAEAALSAAKADIREELDRLSAHIDTGRAHLVAGSPIGRKLDFLAQEMNREANTLCSKSASLDLTNAGLGLKAVIDQFKEQAANVE
ncbi:MAG: YicC/YloC family endoribonuclease [Pseudomonadota bacterium]